MALSFYKSLERAFFFFCLLLGANAQYNLECPFGQNGLRVGFATSLGKTYLQLTNFPDVNSEFISELPPAIPGLTTIYSSRDAILTVPENGQYLFRLESADGSRMFIDGKRVPGPYAALPNVFDSLVDLDAGVQYLLHIDHVKLTSENASITLSYQTPSGSSLEIVPTTAFEPCYLIPDPVSGFDCSLSPPGMVGSYFDSNTRDSNLAPTITRIDENIFFNFATGSPDSFPVDSFSVKWQGVITVSTTGVYQLGAEGNDAVIVSIGGIVVLDTFQEVSFLSDHRLSNLMQLEAGKEYYVEAQFYEDGGQALFALNLNRVFVTGTSSFFSSTFTRACIPPAIVSPFKVSITGKTFVDFPVRLRTPPDGKVAVFVLTSAGARASPCILYFDQTNWNIAQDVSVFGNNGDVVTFETDGLSGGNQIESSRTVITGGPDSGKGVDSFGPQCTSWGDPHFVTFDGIRYDYFGVGDYYLVRTLDSRFVIQTRQQPCSTASCNYAVAVKYDNTLLIFYIDPVTDLPRVYGNAALQNLNGFTLTSEGTVFTATYPNFFSVVLSAHIWAGFGWYLNVFPRIPLSYQGQVRGLCGTYTNNVGDEFHDIDGNIVDFTTFTNSWIIPPSENLFLNENNTIASLAKIGDILPDPLLFECIRDPPPQPIETTINIDHTPIPPQTITCDLSASEIEDYCRILFIDSAIAQSCIAGGYDTTDLYQNCITEVSTLCAFEVILPAAKVFEDECREVCTTCDLCKNSCSFAGNCNTGTCECDIGSFGDFCQFNLDNQPCAVQVTPGNGKAGDNVTVSGEFFQIGETAECVFGSQITTPTFVGPFQAICPVPGGNPPGKYSVIVRFNGNGEDCGATFTYNNGKGFLDPHFSGFNGEQMEIKKDEKAANKLYHLYCSKSITITTLFHEYPDKLLFMTKFWVRLGEIEFTLNLSPIPQILNYHEAPVFLPELGRYRVTIPDGHLEWDDSVLRVVYRYLRVNFSNKIYINGDAYMNADINVYHAPTEKEVSGIIGRTLWNKLTNEEFEKYEQYQAQLEDVLSFTCPY